MPNSSRIVRGTPDNTYRVVRNLHSTILQHGDCVQWLTTADTPPTGWAWAPTGSQLPALAGVDVRLSATANGLLGAGIVFLSPNIPFATGIGQGQYFTILVSGFHPATRTTAAALAAGATINPNSDGKVVAGAIGDDPSSRIGVCLKVGSGNFAGCEIKAQ